MEDTTYDVYLGLDVGKTAHHGCALAADGTKVYDKALPQDEASLRTVFDELTAHGRVLSFAVARACDCEVAYLPGLAMRKATDLYPGQAKTDPRDAFIIANTARTTGATLYGRWTAMLKCFPR